MIRTGTWFIRKDRAQIERCDSDLKIGSPSRRWRVSPALVAPADGPFRGAGQKPAPLSCLPVELRPPPSEGLRGGEVPPASPPTFFSHREMSGCQVALHEDADRAMVIEGWPT